MVYQFAQANELPGPVKPAAGLTGPGGFSNRPLGGFSNRPFLHKTNKTSFKKEENTYLMVLTCLSW